MLVFRFLFLLVLACLVVVSRCYPLRRALGRWLAARLDPPAWPGRCRGCLGPRFGARSCRRLPGGGCEFRF